MNFNSSKPLTLPGQRPSGQGSHSALTIDNVFRRALKVANPRDPDEVAKALLTRYATDATLIRREQAGVPLSSIQFAGLTRQPSGPLSSETKQATDDLERDLGALVTDIQLKDIAAELRGLSGAVRNATSMGLESAHLALDPMHRDRVFTARRALGDYSRLTRLLGALTSCATALYCRVSESIDTCANIILVSAGEALAAAGVTKSGGLLQFPAADLQARRDAVLSALRMLLGTEGDLVIALNNVLGGDSSGPAAAAAVALGNVNSKLVAAGAQDLRSLLDQGFVADLLDDLLDRSIAATPDTLRSLGPTAAVTTRMLVRFANIVWPLNPPLTGVSPRAGTPPDILVANYADALRSIARGYDSTSVGYRLPFLARPPLLSYGLYGVGGADTGSALLQELTVYRTQVAELIDCFCCTCDKEDAISAVVASKLLFDIDRAIDLFSLGDKKDARGKSEAHAAAYAYVVEAALDTALSPSAPDINAVFSKVQHLLFMRESDDVTIWGQPALGTSVDAVRARLTDLLEAQKADEERWRDFALAMTPICNRSDILGDGIDDSQIGMMLNRAIARI